MSKPEHTPTPWDKQANPDRAGWEIVGNDETEYKIGHLYLYGRANGGPVRPGEGLANVDYMLKAVNFHESLVEVSQYGLRMADREAELSKGTSAYHSFKERADKFHAILKLAGVE